MSREKVTKYETNGMDRSAAKRKAHDKTDEKKEMFPQDAGGVYVSIPTA